MSQNANMEIPIQIDEPAATVAATLAEPLEIAEQETPVTADESPDLPLGPGPFPGIRRPLRSLSWLFHVLLGVGFLLPLMAGLAAFPGLSLLSLGFMLEAESQVGRSGRFRNGFPLLPVSTRVGTIALMVFLFLLPVIAISSVAGSQDVITRLSGLPPGGLRYVNVVLQVLVFTHLLLAITNGGSFGAFLSPFAVMFRGVAHVFGVITRRRGLFEFPHPLGNLHLVIQRVRAGTLLPDINLWADRLLKIFRPWHHLKIAFKAAVGALCWLVIPTFLLGSASTSPHQNPAPTAILSIVGGALMIPVAAWLPLLQCHQAATGRFGAIFEVRAVREIICRVPIRWAVATILMYALAVPLYLSKVVLPPADAFWLFTPLFILVIYPTRILMGWVYGTGTQKADRAGRLLRWPTKVVMLPLLGVYSAILFVLPLVSEAGPQAMLENHAFLLPVPSGQFEQN